MRFLLARRHVLMCEGIVTIGNGAEEVLCAIGRAAPPDERLLEPFPALVVGEGGVADGLRSGVADQRRVVLLLSDGLRAGDARADRHQIRNRPEAAGRRLAAVVGGE